MKQIWIRLTSETPTFFKKIRTAGFASIGLGTAILGLPTTIAGVGLSIVFPPTIVAIAGYLIAGGVVAVKVSSLAVVDAKVLEQFNETVEK